MAIGREITELQERIGYHFSDLSYLENALTPSDCHETPSFLFRFPNIFTRPIRPVRKAT